MVGRRRFLWVPGDPVPQGSKTIARHGDSVWLRDVNARKLAMWRRAVAEACPAPFVLAATLDGPLRLSVTFYMPRPKRPRYDRPAVKPDLDKLVRAVCDGLTQGGVIADDARIVSAQIDEYYANAGATGARIEIEEI